jgi:predicted DNA-binding transcriptional regulator AlpA
MNNNQTPPIMNLRVKEASIYLGVGVSTIWLYAKQGKLNPIKLSPRVTIFKREELDQFIINSSNNAKSSKNITVP